MQFVKGFYSSPDFSRSEYIKVCAVRDKIQYSIVQCRTESGVWQYYWKTQSACITWWASLCPFKDLSTPDNIPQTDLFPGAQDNRIFGLQTQNSEKKTKTL